MLNIAIVCGGYSNESAVSFKSAQTVIDQIDLKKFKPYLVKVTKKGWFAIIDETEVSIDKNDFSFPIENQTIRIDCVYNIIHGAPGENGELQAYWDLIKLPYTGSGFYASALSFNKKDCIAVLNKYGIKSAQSIYIKEGDYINHQSIANRINFPCFVKPNQSGSSLGISKVHKKAELENALQKAFKEDSDVLIESFLDGTEVSVGIVEYNNDVVLTGITEIISENEFFDYEAKYQGKSIEITPARISSSQAEKVEEVARKIYSILNIKGASRSEFIFVGDDPYFLESNTVPGFSKESILPQQLKSNNISLQEYITDQIDNAIKLRSNEQQ